MGATSYLAFAAPTAPAVPAPVRRLQRTPCALAAAAALALATAGLSMVTGGARVDAAAARASDLVAQYTRLRPSDFDKAILPIARTLAGTDLTGQPVACGVVVSGIQDGTVVWQRAGGTCAATRLRRPGGLATAAVPAHATLVAVELQTAWPRIGMQDPTGYAVAYASPRTTLPPVQ